MHSSTTMDSQSSASLESPKQPRVLGHKRRRSAAPAKHEDTVLTSPIYSCCTTSGESSSDESDSSSIYEEDPTDAEEVMAAAKRRRRADLDGLKKSMRRMEAQVVGASAQLRDLAALVAEVVARRQQQQHQLRQLQA